ncbi:hypothetical protein IQ07DRAFT_143352 [Pyrenochaeta sp. DS3sAY3a]|nr:hypothetical protein IQ07DRAFT_143352 [Pyrenochaeta sp. DS3sAY3a]
MKSQNRWQCLCPLCAVPLWLGLANEAQQTIREIETGKDILMINDHDAVVQRPLSVSGVGDRAGLFQTGNACFWKASSLFAGKSRRATGVHGWKLGNCESRHQSIFRGSQTSGQTMNPACLGVIETNHTQSACRARCCPPRVSWYHCAPTIRHRRRCCTHNPRTCPGDLQPWPHRRDDCFHY